MKVFLVPGSDERGMFEEDAVFAEIDDFESLDFCPTWDYIDVYLVNRDGFLQYMRSQEKEA